MDGIYTLWLPYSILMKCSSIYKKHRFKCGNYHISMCYCSLKRSKSLKKIQYSRLPRFRQARTCEDRPTEQARPGDDEAGAVREGRGRPPEAVRGGQLAGVARRRRLQAGDARSSRMLTSGAELARTGCMEVVVCHSGMAGGGVALGDGWRWRECRGGRRRHG
jgi:hypothetical protein